MRHATDCRAENTNQIRNHTVFLANPLDLSATSSFSRRSHIAVAPNSVIRLIPLQITIDAPSPTCPFPDDFNNSSFLMSGESRRQSVSSESIAKLMRAVSPESSDDEDVDDASNFLKVMEKGLNQRRHSDTPLQVPRKFSVSATPSPVASRSPSPSLITRARSSSNLINSSHRRRHSSVNPHDIQRFASKLMDSAAESMVESVEKASKVRRDLASFPSDVFPFHSILASLTSPAFRDSSLRVFTLPLLPMSILGRLASLCRPAHSIRVLTTIRLTLASLLRVPHAIPSPRARPSNGALPETHIRALIVY